MINFYLRDAKDEDIFSIANIIALAFEEHRGKLSPPSSSLGKTPESVRAELQSAKAVVAIKDDTMIGCVFYSVKEDFVYLAHLAVAPEYRGSRAKLQQGSTFCKVGSSEDSSLL